MIDCIFIARVDIESKDLAKKLGLTYNKKMLEDSTSEETSAFNLFIKESMDSTQIQATKANISHFTKLRLNMVLE